MGEVMTFRKFFDQYINGYLVGDLRTLIGVAESHPEANGRCVYPLLFTTCAGMELAGCLFTKDPRKWTEGSSFSKCGFEWAWTQLYPAKSDLGPFVYRTVRNGLAHLVTPRGMVRVTWAHPETHLTLTSGNHTLVVDAPTLARDLISAIGRWKDDPACMKRARSRYGELLKILEDAPEWPLPRGAARAPLGIVEFRDADNRVAGRVRMLANSPSASAAHRQPRR